MSPPDLTLQDYIEELRLLRAASDSMRPSKVWEPGRGFQSHEELLIASWRQADGYAEGVLTLSTHSPPLERPIFVLARSLLEGSMTLMYVALNATRRLDQMRIGCLEDCLRQDDSVWGKRAPKDPRFEEMRADMRRQVEAAYAKEKAYTDARKLAKQRKQSLPPNDWDAYARLPNFFERVRAIGYEDMYDPVYGMGSGFAHWSLSGFFTAQDPSEEPPEPTLMFPLDVATVEFRILVECCAILLDVPRNALDAVPRHRSDKMRPPANLEPPK